MTALSPRLKEVVDDLQGSRGRLLAAVAPLGQDDLDFSPLLERWSIGEILHHLQLIELSVTRVLAKQVQRAGEEGLGPDPRTDSVRGSVEALQIETSPDKITTSAGFTPQRGLPRQALLDGLSVSRTALIAETERANPFDLSRMSFPHPVFGRLDMYQWLLFIAQHELRHLHQIERVR